MGKRVNLLISDYDEPNDDYGRDDAFGRGLGLGFDGEPLVEGIDGVFDDYAVPGYPGSVRSLAGLPDGAARGDGSDGDLGGYW